MILFKKIYKLKILLFIFIALSCSTKGIYKSEKIIKKIEKQKYKSDRPQYNYIKQKYNEDRNSINNFIHEKKLKNFILEELIYFRKDLELPFYRASITTEKGIYNFRIRDNIEDIKRDQYGGCFHYTFKNDSIYINKRPDNPENKEICNKEIIKNTYFTNYKEGKLTQLNKNNSIIFKNIKDNMKINLNIVKWYEKNKECTKSTYSIKCEIIKGEKLH